MSTVLDLGSLDPRLRGLERRSEGKLTSGLCRALAERLQIDPLLIRLATIGLVLVGGLGLVLYAWGTLLTPRVGGEPPIRRLLPAFEHWSRTTQIAVVVGTVIATVALRSLTGSVPWGPVIVVGVILVLLRRRAVPRPGAPTGPPSGWAPPTALGGSVDESVDAWRSRMAAHGTRTPPADALLPEVDLYAPAPEPRPHPPLAARAPQSWLGAAAILVLGLVAAGATLALGLTPDLLWAAAAMSVVVGVAMVAWSLLVRSRRLPGLLLAVAMLGAAGTAGLASWAAESAAEAPAGDGHYVVVGQSDAVVDLSALPLDEPTTVTIEARFSDVRVILPGDPLEVSTQTQLGDVTEADAVGRPSQLTLVIDATLASVDLETQP